MRNRLKIFIVWLSVFCGFVATAYAKPTYEYLGKGLAYDTSVPLSETLFGHEIGDGHVSPTNPTAYMRRLGDQSVRVHTATIGYSVERKALVHVIISSADNIKNLDTLLEKHQNATSAKNDILVLNLSYSVHGNEPSGANASPLYKRRLERQTLQTVVEAFMGLADAPEFIISDEVL